MIFAELQGKLGRNYSRAHERAEDVMTSTVFGLIRYLPIETWLGALVEHIRIPSTKWQRAQDWIDVTEIKRCDLKFWEGNIEYGWPDLVIRLYDNMDQLRHLLVIEVKLLSPKSGSEAISESEPAMLVESDQDEGEPEGISNDQLVKYWQFACKEQRMAVIKADKGKGHQVGASLVYLTAHPAPPIKDLDGSLLAAGEKRPPIRLGWLSWFDIWEIVHHAAKGLPLPNPAQDLADLLRHKGFSRFTGFKSEEASIDDGNPGCTQFWRRRNWFDLKTDVPSGHTRFWVGNRRNS